MNSKKKHEVERNSGQGQNELSTVPSPYSTTRIKTCGNTVSVFAVWRILSAVCIKEIGSVVDLRHLLTMKSFDVVIWTVM